MRRGYLGLLAALVLLVVALGAGAVQAQQTQTISLTEFQFAPETLTATVGQPVNWTFRNDGQFPHDFRVQVAGQTIDAVPADGNVMPGQSATLTFTFTTPGTFEFWCPVGQHRERGMVGTLTVAAAGAAASQPKPGAPAPKPSPPAGMAPVQVPQSLPRTGEADSTPWMLGGLVAVGLVLLGAGVVARRRGI